MRKPMIFVFRGKNQKITKQRKLYYMNDAEK